MKFLCRKVLIIFLISAFVAGVLWFFIINQTVIDTTMPIATAKINSDICVQKMVLHIDDAVVYADQVLGDKASKNIQLVGRAKLLWKEFEFLGTNFLYQKDECLIRTKEPITITMPHIVTTADGMKIDTKQQIIELQGAICTIFNKK